MANIKLKDLINEIGISGFVSESPWTKREDDSPSINVNELVNSIKNYGSVAESLSKIAEGAAQHTLSETEDMFDKVTVSRNMKELTGLSKQFGKVAGEANSLQERMSGLYEDMGNILGRYYEIGEGEVKSEDSDTRDFKEDDGYKAFFQKALKKWGVSSPDKIKDEDKKEFYDYVDRNWKADKETD